LPLNPLTSHYEGILVMERAPVQFHRCQAAINQATLPVFTISLYQLIVEK